MESPVPEIFGMIVSHFDGDKNKRALKSCVLVSRTWLQLTRPYLFHSTTITGTHSERNFAAFIQLLSSPGNGIAHNLSKLELSSLLSNRRQDNDQVDNSVHRQLSISTLYSILSSLPALRYLTLRLINMPVDLGFTPPNHKMSIRLQRLNLYQLQVSELAFFTILSFFESVDDLHIFLLLPADGASETDVGIFPAQYRGPHVQVSSLTLMSPTPIGICTPLLDMYFQHRPSGSIKIHLNISAASPSFENILDIGDQIRARHAGFQLQHIDLDTWNLYLALKRRLGVEILHRRDWACSNLTSYDAVTSLGLSIPYGPFITAEVSMICWTSFSDVLSTAPTTVLQLRLHIIISSEEIATILYALEQCEWGRVKPALVRFSALERVTVWVQVTDEESLREGRR